MYSVGIGIGTVRYRVNVNKHGPRFLSFFIRTNGPQDVLRIIFMPTYVRVQGVHIFRGLKTSAFCVFVMCTDRVVGWYGMVWYVQSSCLMIKYSTVR